MTDKGSLGDTEDLLQAEFCKVPLKCHFFLLLPRVLGALTPMFSGPEQ